MPEEGDETGPVAVPLVTLVLDRDAAVTDRRVALDLVGGVLVVVDQLVGVDLPGVAVLGVRRRQPLLREPRLVDLAG